MKNNWSSLLLVGVCAFFPSIAYSLGLGEIQTDSAINEPLIAEIALTNVGDLESSEVIVAIGTESDYQLAGVPREFFHSEIQFDVQIEDVATPKIIVRSQTPLQDPYINFIVQVRWPQGRILREYTVLLDLPIFSEQQSGGVAAPVTQQPAPSTAREAVERQATQQDTNPQNSSPRQTAPTGGSTFQTDGEYRVSSGDTLWSIADQIERSTGTSLHQAMIAIHEENTDAFVNGDINRLKADAVLRLPSQAQMSTITEGQAARDFSALNQETSATPIQSTSTDFRDAGSSDNSAQSGRLALSTGSNNVTGNGGTSGADSSDVAAQVASNQAASEALAENAALKEELDAAEIENTELQDRVANLEEQIALLEEARALEIQNAELSAVQDALAEEAQQETTPTRPAAEPETFLDKLNKFRYWIIGGFALILIIALLIILLVLRGRKTSEVDDLYYDEGEQIEPKVAVTDEVDEEPEEVLDDEELADEEELDDEDLEDELEEDIDDLAAELTEQVADQEDEDRETIVIPGGAEILDEAESFESAEEDEDVDLGEFEDLDEFFGDDASDATNVLFGAGEVGESIEDEDSESEKDLGDALEFSSPELEDSDDQGEEDTVEGSLEDEGALDFELSDLSPEDDTAPEVSEDSDIDLEDKFGYTEPDVTKDLGPEAEADFEESIEVHSTDMVELLVPSEDDLDAGEDELFLGESPDVSDDIEGEADELMEEVEEEVDALLEADQDEDEPAESVLEADEELDLDEDMDADLGDLDLGDDDLSAEDADEEFLTKLELAEAYIEMGDVHGARELLSEVEKDGNAEQKAAAKSLLEGIDK